VAEPMMAIAVSIVVNLPEAIL